jgi:hypothetical protein
MGHQAQNAAVAIAIASVGNAADAHGAVICAEDL